ncbi:T9SS type A sorting domain-containing protein [Flavobacterium sp. LS1R49]|uniref:T9SS type A sorting domain-containing protein n=1 Tax=Flavobacterium shii TaxID=2987687 RepID=A0A9X2ZHM5_9FLAO|nr:T9SS type A sorting domain-containing protein [Flavobacterium shii]MCV9927863.1 T9SS type A sorting domain-containing protein [Flavobacterium shii]
MKQLYFLFSLFFSIFYCHLQAQTTTTANRKTNTVDNFQTAKNNISQNAVASEICITPTIFNVTGGGNGCFTTGVPVGLLSSEIDVNYQLKLNGVATGNLIAGTGAALSFGNKTTSGIYTIDAVTSVAGCPTTVITMGSTATVNIDPVSVGGSISGTKTVCKGETSDLLTLSNQTGNVLRWESSVSPFSSWTPITNTTPTYTSGALTQATQFRAIVQNGSCLGMASAVATITVKSITATIARTNISCNLGRDGTITVTPDGGTAPYYYLWTSTSGGPSGATTAKVTGLLAGNYTCTVTDALGCSTAFTNLIVTQPTALRTTQVRLIPVSCNGGSNGSATISATGGTFPLTYNWTPGNPTGDGTTTVTGLTAGLWTCNITDASGCTISRDFTVKEPTVIVTTQASLTNVTCNGGANGTARISVSGGTTGYTFDWSPGTPVGDGTASVIGLSAGEWTCNITDANGCTAKRFFTVTEPAVLAASTTQTNVSCNLNSNGTATINTPTGGAFPYTYLWNTGATSQSLSGLSAGIYSCTITDNNGCTLDKDFTITEPAVLAATTTQTNVSCNLQSNGTATINTPTGGTFPYTYLWNTGATSQSLSGLSPGIYSCTITDNNNCTLKKDFTITEPAVLAASTTQTNVSCNLQSNGTATINTPTGGTFPYTYLWNTGATSQSLSGLSAGIYSCTITDNNGCILDKDFTITEPAVLAASTTQTNVSCNSESNGTATINTPTGGTFPYTYLWNTGATSQSLSGLSAGIYSCTITDNNGCTLDKDFTITEPAVLAASTAQTNVSCNSESNGTATINTPTGGTFPYTYLWNTEATSQSLSGLSAGIYSCTITDNNGCTLDKDFTITEPAAIDISLALSSGIITTNQNGATYQWIKCPNTALVGQTNQNFTPTISGDYKVKITIGNCTVTTNCITVSTLGNEKFESKPKIIVYPNPSNDVFFVNIATNCTMITCDLLGKTIQSQKIDSGTTKIDLSNQPTGIYLLKVTTENNQTQTIKLIKK